MVGAAVAEAAGAGEGPARRGGGAGAGAGWGAGAEARGWGSPTRPTALGNKIPARHDPAGQFGDPEWASGKGKCKPHSRPFRTLLGASFHLDSVRRASFRS